MTPHLHPTDSACSGKALPLLLVVIALAAIAFFFVADPFGTGDLDGDDAAGGGVGGDLLGASGETDADPAGTKKQVATLGGLYGDGAFGAIRMRLLWVGGSGKPVIGQEVSLFSRRGEEVLKMPSDELGTVLFAQVRPAKGYRVHISGEGFSQVQLRSITVYPEATKDLGDLILGKDIVLRGRVVDAQGRPVPGTSVSVHSIQRDMAAKGFLFSMAEQAGRPPIPLTSVASDEEGNFAFSALDDGRYTLVARHGGHASKHEHDVIVAQERGAGVLTLVLGISGRLFGVVTDPDGKPVVGASIMAVRDVGFGARMRSLEREVTVTGDDGAYVLDTLTAGSRYRLGVVAKGFAPFFTTNPFDVDEGDMERDFTLVEGGHLSGVVTDEQTGEPIADAKVAIFVGRMSFGRGQNADPDEKTVADVRRTDDEGRFKFESVTPGPVASAIVRASGYVSVTPSQWTGNAWPAIEAGQTSEVAVVLKRGGTITGFVRVGEEPIQGAEVSVMGSAGMAAMRAMFAGVPTAMTGPDGAYLLTGVEPGKYRLFCVAGGFSADAGQEGVELEVPTAGGTIEKDLSMSAAGTITGVVVDPGGEPIAGVRIRLRAGRAPDAGGGGGNRGRRGGNRMRRFLTAGRNPVDLTDDAGKFQLDGVVADAMWVVYGESDEYVSGESKAIKLAAGGVKKVRITMLAGGALRGRVLDENGRVLAGARVQVGHLDEDLLKDRNLNAFSASRALGSEVYVTDEAGRFLATNLKPGPGIVRAMKDGYVTFFKRNLTITPGETVDGYSIPLTKGGVVEGRVVGADGAPIRRAMVAVTKQDNPGVDDEGENANDGEEASEDVEPMMFGRTGDDGTYKIENVEPGVYSVVIWMAGRGHQGWAREHSEAAIKRGISVPAEDIDFKLEKSKPRPNPLNGGNGGGGNR